VKKRLKIILPVLAILLAYGAYRIFWTKGALDEILLSGNIEVTDARLGFKIQGRLAKRLVDEGEDVGVSQTLALLDPVDETLAVAVAEANLAREEAALGELEAGSRPEEIRVAEAKLEEARHALEELQAGSRIQEVADARAEVARAEESAKGAAAALELARLSRERLTRLSSEGVASPQDFDSVRTEYDARLHAHEEAMARLVIARERLSLSVEGPRAERIAAAKAAHEAALAHRDLVKAGTRPETIKKAEAQVRVSRESLRQARQRLVDATLAAPFAGTILSKSAEPGEYLSPGSPVVTVGDLDHPWLRVYLGERDLARVKLGQAVEVTTDSAPDRVFAGRVGFISGEAEFTPKSVQTFEERTKLVYRVKVYVGNPGRALKPGMPADARIRIERG
jgi:HlyD family secretion protein